MSRNTIDLLPVWTNTSPAPKSFTGVVEQFAAAAPVAPRSHPGHWNDPDMLVVGLSWQGFVNRHPGMLAGIAQPGTLTPDQLAQAELLKPPSPQVFALIGAQRPSLTDVEERAQFSLWAMLAAPLLAGNDVRSMSEQTRTILNNPEIIAVDQDPLVIQATALPSDSRVLVKPLADGAVAVGMFNSGPDPLSIQTTAAAIGLKNQPCYTVHDMWAHTDTTTTGRIQASDIPAHGVVALRVTSACP
jgi:alpha-galactosidase